MPEHQNLNETPKVFDDELDRAPLYAALAKAMKQAKAVEKDAKNQHHKYRYASAEAILSEVRGPLADNGLALIPLRQRYERSPEEGDKLNLKMTYLLTHESGAAVALESWTPIIPGQGRPEDKATATAKTYDVAYLLRTLLCLPRVDESEQVDSRDDRERNPSKPAATSHEQGWSREERDKDNKQRKGETTRYKGSATERKAQASARMAEISQLKGKEWCASCIGGRPRKSAKDYEDIVGILEYNIVKDEQVIGEAVDDSPAPRDESKFLAEDVWVLGEEAGLSVIQTGSLMRESYDCTGAEQLTDAQLQKFCMELSALREKPHSPIDPDSIPY